MSCDVRRQTFGSSLVVFGHHPVREMLLTSASRKRRTFGNSLVESGRHPVREMLLTSAFWKVSCDERRYTVA